jgi:hypothetical protein
MSGRKQPELILDAMKSWPQRRKRGLVSHTYEGESVSRARRATVFSSSSLLVLSRDRNGDARDFKPQRRDAMAEISI